MGKAYPELDRAFRPETVSPSRPVRASARRGAAQHGRLARSRRSPGSSRSSSRYALYPSRRSPCRRPARTAMGQARAAAHFRMALRRNPPQHVAPPSFEGSTRPPAGRPRRASVRHHPHRTRKAPRVDASSVEYRLPRSVPLVDQRSEQIGVVVGGHVLYRGATPRGRRPYRSTVWARDAAGRPAPSARTA